MILIITGLAADLTIARLSKALQTYNAEHLIIAASTMEQMAALSISGAEHGSRSVLRLNQREIDLTQIHSAWLWRTWSRDPYEPRLSDLAKQEREWSFFRGEWLAFCKGLSLTLAYSGVFCVNPPPFNHAFEEKCCQMMVAAQVGLRIPATLYTASLPLARAFYDQHGAAIIYKPFKSYMRIVEEDSQPPRVHKLYTNRVQAGQLVETDRYIPSPGIFQPYVEKQIELRVVVIGRNLFACAIHSQQSARSREDWRRYDFDNTPYEFLRAAAGHRRQDSGVHGPSRAYLRQHRYDRHPGG